MPKEINIDPVEIRQPSLLSGKEIPVNAYIPDQERESERYGVDSLVSMYRDIVQIREFENMLDSVKKQGSYKGVDCTYSGPAHLAIGQEAVAVGMAHSLTPEDVIFGAHRSHGEILAKSFSAIRQLGDDRLSRVMESYIDDHTLRVVRSWSNGDIKETGRYYALYGLLAEILGRASGFNKGMGGSMHAFFPPFGIMPNNAIVGGSAGLATGAALYKRVNRRPGICIANIGDAASSCGPVWEAINFAAMDQYRTLWDEDLGGAPPILFHFINNFYGMGGQTFGETMGFKILARIGSGVNPDGMHAERVDGCNPIAVADATARKRQVLLDGRGPVLLDTITYRFMGHSPSDADSYREKEEIELWRQHDPVLSYGNYLKENEHLNERAMNDIYEDVIERTVQVLVAASSENTSPRLAMSQDGIGELMFSDQYRDKMNSGTPEVLLPKSKTRLQVTSKKHRFGLKNGDKLSKLKTLSYAEALYEAMMYRFYEDPSMIAFGQENRDWGGAFGVYRGLTECLPYHRLFNAPIAEAAIVAAAVGYAISGGRVVAELMYCDFMGRAGDEIFNQMSKWQSMSGGILKMPLVLRVSVGSKYGAQHSQDWTSLASHIPGLKVMFPATPYDAKGMLNLALRGTDPVIFFESQRLYNESETVVESGVPGSYYEIILGEPAIRRSGHDVTIVTIGATLYKALEAADILEGQHKVSAEVIDARFVNPLNYDLIIQSIKKTGKIVLASDACDRGSFLHTMASNISQMCFDYLDGPVGVVGARNWITPPGELEDIFFPQANWIIDTIHERILPLAGYQPMTTQATSEILRRNALGI